MWNLKNNTNEIYIQNGNRLTDTENKLVGFPGGTVDRNPPTNAAARVRSLVWKDSTYCGATCTMTAEPTL